MQVRSKGSPTTSAKRRSVTAVPPGAAEALRGELSVFADYERGETVMAAFDVVYDSLPAAGKAALQRLSVVAPDRVPRSLAVDEDDHVLLVEQYRVPLGRNCIELPAGLIGDDDGGRNLPLTNEASDDFTGTLAAGAVMFYREDFKFVASKPSQEVLWLFGAEGLTIFDSLGENEPEKTSNAFTDGGYFVMRDGWAKTDNYMIVDAGEVGSLNGGHGHADTLAFEVAAGGRPILVDSGT